MLNQPQQMPMQPQGEVTDQGAPPVTGQEVVTEQQDGTSNEQKWLVATGMHILYDKKMHPKFIKLLTANADQPALALSDTTLKLFQYIKDKTKSKLPDEIVAPAAIELLMTVAQLAFTAKLFKVDKAIFEEAVAMVTQGLIKMYSIGQQEIAAYMQEQGLAQPGAQQPGQPGTGAPPGQPNAQPPSQTPGILNNAAGAV